MKILLKNWFYRDDLNVINDWLNEAQQSKVSAVTGKKEFVKKAAEWLSQYQKNEEKAWKMYLLSVPNVDANSDAVDYKVDEKINIIIDILSERKKDIEYSKKIKATWIGIAITFITGIILPLFTSVKSDEQFNALRYSIEQTKQSLQSIDAKTTNATTAIDTLKVNITNNKARTKSNNQSK